MSAFFRLASTFTCRSDEIWRPAQMKSGDRPRSAGMKAKSKCSGGAHSAHIVVKKTKASTGASYIKTAYVGIARKVLVRDGSVRYRVLDGRKYLASGEMTLAQAKSYLHCGRVEKKPASQQEDVSTWVKRYKVMRRLFADHEPADLTANLAFLEKRAFGCIATDCPCGVHDGNIEQSCELSKTASAEIHGATTKGQTSCELDFVAVRQGSLAGL